MQQTTVSWLVYNLTHSSIILGWSIFLNQLPTLLIGPFAGVLADRVPRRQALLWTQVFAMAQALVLATLLWLNLLPLWGLLVLITLLGCIQSVDNPLRQSYVPELFKGNTQHIANAVAINSATFNAARLFGPMLAGWVIVSFGSVSGIMANALSYIAVIWALMGLPSVPVDPNKPVTPVFTSLKAGFAMAWAHPWMRLILTLIVFNSLFVMPYVVLLPVMAVKLFKGGAAEYSYLLSAAGGGSLLGALWLASRQSYGLGLYRIVGGCVLMGFGLLGLSFSHYLPVACACLLVVGFGWIVQMASCNMRLQQLATNENRGRIMSLYSLSFIGMAPFGSVMAGWLANVLGCPVTLTLQSLACLLVGVFTWVQLKALIQQPSPEVVPATPRLVA
jgi:MFS family permease